MKQALAVLALLLLVGVKFVGVSWFETLDLAVVYGGELVFAIAVMVTFRKPLRLGVGFGRLELALVGGAGIAGIATYLLAIRLGLAVPFDFASAEVLLMLGLVGPILEELLFRQGAWLPIEYLSRRAGVAGIATSLLFAVDHFTSSFFVPEEYRSFIYYQTGYALLLGLVAGYAYLRTRSLRSPILVHIVFNWGFYLGHRLSLQ